MKTQNEFLQQITQDIRNACCEWSKVTPNLNDACQDCGESLSELGKKLSIFSARKPRRKRTHWKNRSKK